VSTTPAARRSLLRRKPVGALVHETGADREGGELERSIGLFQLTMFGVGATIGTGIFIVLSEAVPEAGPAVVLSFVLAGITAALTAVCYAELASTIPVSGSSYSYTYATMGEIVAFGVAACLLLEYGVSSAAVSVGWGEYLNSFFTSVFGFRLPDAISLPPGEGGVFNVPAVVLVTLCGLLLARGARVGAGEHDHGADQTSGSRPVHRHRLLGVLGRERPAVRAVRGRGHRPGRFLDLLLVYRP
jgi:APA family basic amino acid/polyamine antiporter